MNERRDWRLIRQYVETNSESAFAQLIKTYSSLVFGTCLKELKDKNLAEDAYQVVFIILARKARTLRSDTVLAAWLFETCRLTAKNIRRVEKRRRMGEEKMAREVHSNPAGWNPDAHDMGALLYEVLCSLPQADCQAVLLRHVCGYSFAETGAEIAISEEAARKRVNRALVKLKQRLLQLGVAITVVDIVDLLDTQIASAASPEIAARTTSLALSHPTLSQTGAGPFHIATGVIKSMAIIKTATIGAAVCATLVAGVGAARFASARLLPATFSSSAMVNDTAPTWRPANDIRPATPTDINNIINSQQLYATTIHTLKYASTQTDTNYVDLRTFAPVNVWKKPHTEKFEIELLGPDSKDRIRRMASTKHYPSGSLDAHQTADIDFIEIYDGKKELRISGQPFYGPPFNGKYHRDGNVSMRPGYAIPDMPLEVCLIGSTWISDALRHGSISEAKVIQDPKFGPLVKITFTSNVVTSLGPDVKTLYFAIKYDYILVHAE